MNIVVVPLYAGLLALIYLFLTVRTIRARRRYKVSVGFGTDPQLTRIVRVHGNFIEYVPLILVLMLLLELRQFLPLVIHLCGILLVVSRVVHAFGVSQIKEKLVFRIAGMVLTLFLLTVLGVLNLYLAIP